MSPTIEAVVSPVELGEGPHWSHDEKTLYFVSIFDKTINKYIPATNKYTKSTLDDTVGFIIPVEGQRHHFVVGVGLKLLLVKWTGDDEGAKVIKTIADVDRDNPKNRFNDAKADPRGRLFAGTMGHEFEPGKFLTKKGALYRFDEHGKATKVIDNVDISNGMAWDVKEKAFYFADSFEYAISRYDYDIETGNISNKKHIFDLKSNGVEGIADGMTIDTDGNLWVANFDGRRVIKVDPKRGKILQSIPIPALQVTSATFGGENFDILFVTSAKMNRGEEQPPPCGSTFKVAGLGVKGHPNINVKYQL